MRRRSNEPRTAPPSVVAAEDADRLAAEVASLLDRPAGDWYEPRSDADRLALALCRLRRARAGAAGAPRHGDEAVRAALAAAPPETLVWLLSRAISYMDESGFPEAVEIWFRDVDSDPAG